MTEFLLAITMMWVTPQGQLKSAPLDGVFTSYQACMEAITSRVDVLTRVNGVVPTPTGTVMCTPRDKPHFTPEEEAYIEHVRKFNEQFVPGRIAK